MANWREELLVEGPFDKPPSVLRRDAAAAAKKDARETKAEKEEEKSQDYRQYLKDVLATKKKRLEWQQQGSLRKDKERRQREQEARIIGPLKDIKTQTISGKDPDSTAGAKLVGNAASLAGGVARAGVAALAQKIKKKQRKEISQSLLLVLFFLFESYKQKKQKK